MVRKSAPASSRCVAKQWRSVCGWTRFFKPARWAACLTAWKTLLALIGLKLVRSQYSRSSSSSLGLSMTVAILIALALVDVNQHAGTVDIIHFQLHQFFAS